MVVLVGGIQYEIVFVDQLPQIDGETAYGLCDHVNQRITIYARLSKRKRAKILMHELWHAWRHEWPFDIDHEEDAAEYASLIWLHLMIDMATSPALTQLVSMA